jgi:1-deoxy-D-xylulose-5-phosphate synthase
MTILENINSPSDLKKLNGNDLIQLAGEIRDQIIKTISKNGGHLASSLGAVELTIALHRVFDSPRDKIIWDVGHQSYAHKLITGRRDRFETIRQYSGLSGFPSPEESPYDAFVSGHAGNSISAALGMALARDLNKENYQVIAVIGDGSIGSGMAFEAINHTGHLGTKLIIVLNDNGVSISPSVGALARLLNQVRTDARYSNAKRRVRRAVDHMPFGKSAWTLSLRMKKSFQRVILPNAFWEELGFTYLGPLDGHSIREIETALIRARDIDTGPTVIHVLTQKGKGYPQAEEDVVKYHGISPDAKVKGPALQFNQILGGMLSRLMPENPRLVVISAAMLEGTGLAKVAADYPGRVFDVGICEQHAVTLAAGLASQGFIPVVAMYSTFLQRAYDQIIHDVCLPNLPVIFAVDRAGIVGEDGKTHHGPFDMSFLRCVPNMLIASPADENDLQNLFYSALSYRKPIAIRYPRGEGQGVVLSSDFSEIKPGRGEIVRPGKDLTILAIGPVVYAAVEAADALAAEGIDCAVVNARFSKPVDAELIRTCLSCTSHILTVEENALTGGFGSAVTEFIRADGLTARIKCLGLPDIFIEHGPQELLRSLYNIDAEGIAQTVRDNFVELFPVVASRDQEES